MRLRSRRCSSARCSRPRGLRGGGDGGPTRLSLDGKPIDPKQSFRLEPGSEFVIETPGGGGYGYG